MAIDLHQLVSDFAAGLMTADRRSPVAKSLRSGRCYAPGIGPHAEDLAVALVVAEMQRSNPAAYASARTGIRYPSGRQLCDLGIGDPLEWAVEVKMGRPNGDNGKPDDTWIKDLLSPYLADRSALSDVTKLAGSSPIAPKRAVLIYGFDDLRRPLAQILNAFEMLAGTRAVISARAEAMITDLVHPVHAAGRVSAWQIMSPIATQPVL